MLGLTVGRQWVFLGIPAKCFHTFLGLVSFRVLSPCDMYLCATSKTWVVYNTLFSHPLLFNSNVSNLSSSKTLSECRHEEKDFALPSPLKYSPKSFLIFSCLNGRLVGSAWGFEGILGKSLCLAKFWLKPET